MLLKLVPATTILWTIANTCIKVSILHFYKSIFGVNTVLRRTNNAVSAVVISFGLGIILQAFLICRPFAKNWDPLLPGVCGSISQATLAEAIINMIIDLAIIISPMPVVWRLQMSLWRKLALTIIFGLGFMYVLILLVRLSITDRCLNKVSVCPRSFELYS